MWSLRAERSEAWQSHLNFQLSTFNLELPVVKPVVAIKGFTTDFYKKPSRNTPRQYAK
jgi:hypothetical protein